MLLFYGEISGFYIELFFRRGSFKVSFFFSKVVTDPFLTSGVLGLTFYKEMEELDFIFSGLEKFAFLLFFILLSTDEWVLKS